ncbi:uncharacterized protein LOC115216287 [Octopus sinensis]|uniref:Uncharacterized protein LOC115216287 n=1 Tax=Octopus sinensis TaxID=2607531 RepID=A0A6P7ST29_9MOLL|nr:uncharacterized protein LOC115216287 [Octopus sinensis]
MYRSLDTVDNEIQYRIEFTNKLTASGFPPHILKLKKKQCIVLLRNLDATKGHCNGTRYIIVSLHDHVVEAEIASGPYARSTLQEIPRNVSQEMECPFASTRKYFPVKPAFALTRNKAQGQTFEQIGIYLPAQFFSLAQVYAALSRVRKTANVKNIS